MSRKAKRRDRTSPNIAATQETISLPDIVPLTINQNRLIRAIRESVQVFAIGPEGTGKTYIPSLMAGDALRAGEVSRIILTKPFVSRSQGVGFLPGDVAEKSAPWVAEMKSAICDRIGGLSAWDRAIASGRIEIVAFEHMRGRSFKDAFIILDEAQNTTALEMRMFLTRHGEGSRSVVSGDLRQFDGRGVSGLGQAVQMIEEGRVSVPVIRFTARDIVRSGLCKDWAMAFDSLG